MAPLTIVVFTVLFFLQISSALGREHRVKETDPPAKSGSAKKSHPAFVDDISITGNDVIGDAQIFAEIRTQQNLTYFGFFRPWLGIYKFAEHIFADTSGGAYRFTMPVFSDTSGFKTWIQRTLGEAPKVFNSREFKLDIVRIKEIYNYNGYYHTQIDTSIRFFDDGNRVSLKFMLTEGQPTRIDRLQYQGIDSTSQKLSAAIYESPEVKVGDICAISSIINERDRLLELFQEYGYAFVSTDSISVTIDTLGYNAGVDFTVGLPEPLSFGKIIVLVHNPSGQDSSDQVNKSQSEDVEVKVYGDQAISHSLIRNAIAYRPDMLTKTSLRNKTFQQLGSIGVFETVYIRNDSIQNGKLFTTIDLQLLQQHQIKPSLLIDNRNNAPFFGASFGYLNRNTFGGAESFGITASIGSQLTYNKRLLDGISTSGFFTGLPYNFDILVELGFPHFFSPSNRFSINAQYSFTQLPILLQQQRGLLRFRAQLAPTTFQRITIDILELELVSTDSLRGFQELFTKKLAQNLNIDPNDQDQVKTSIDSLLQQRLNPTIRFDFLFSNLQEARRKVDFNWNFIAEETGFLTYLIDKYIDTKSRPGFTDTDPQIFGLPYSQYIKFTTQFSVVKPIRQKSKIAGKLLLGWMAPYGKAVQTPQERRFYSGGANSMRGWPFNSLGPGQSSNEAASNLGADIKIESSIEYRIKFFTIFNQASGVVFFTDIGNIWNREGSNSFRLDSFYKELAWDGGIGLRIGTPIGPIRLDFAYKIFDPTRTNNQWQLSKWSLTDFTFNFAIGEAF
ncbi:MAG: BamA/TamA family outer membrane protein [Chlorobiales bacterium]|nr:BamA/TamA family outer membrane protein [Chlorobiales bacterium]